MKKKQIAIVLDQLHRDNSIDKNERLKEVLNYFNLNPNRKKTYHDVIIQKFNEGIKQLNNKQLLNIKEKINSVGFDEEMIESRLKFYEIDEIHFDEILSFFKSYLATNVALDVSNIDEGFKGVQVASRDDFNRIINQGFTGDWVLTPNSIKHNFVQVASMNESGQFPRGHYLNAEIAKFSPIKYGDQTRYRIFIKNPIIVDSGNRNVKFNLNPVKYIN